MPNSTLWIEVPASAISGGSGSQIDIPNDAGRRFFGLRPGEPFREKIRISHGSKTLEKVMDWRGGPKLNQQFRLNLLTRSQGGPATYADRLLVIERTGDDPISIRTRVLDPNGVEALELRKRSQAQGTLWETLPGNEKSRWWGTV
jgi:hypothetical protein